MAHKVTFSLPERELGRADIVVVVKRGNAVFGKLLMSKGGIVWRRKWKAKRGKKLSWRALARIMDTTRRTEPR